MRGYHKGWQDRRPGFRFRVRWFEGPLSDVVAGDADIRLEFEEDGEVTNRFYRYRVSAQAAFDDFAVEHGGTQAHERIVGA